MGLDGIELVGERDIAEGMARDGRVLGVLCLYEGREGEGEWEGK